ncbi:putative integral membrane protein [Aspergillus saccharolyticus JOP 1030-1]|uniref:Integral membrane protein n=1 Tax=Aspergillus saccharolyticus JOP 1030-1 TaxID=1450539 RepID=A0A319AV21_9EURO|nr:integral membrane protein [Aspergillus saccharolyticus JOP 1030-1]PYH49912.1 integral membrane protein [Aspergillus saccharolyticus JOP 1030-1]
MGYSAVAQSLQRKHPLQRMSSPSRGFSALVHLLGFASFLWSFKYMHENPNHANEAYGWHFQYLTVLGLSLSLITITCGLIADLTLSPRIFLVKNLLSMCCTPLEVLISILYWGLRLIDEHLVIPDWAVIPLNAGDCLLLNIPAMTDISFHAVPSIILMIDLLFLSPPWTITILPALGLSSTIAVGYWFWIERCFQYNGWYPYPIFEVAGFEGRVGIFALSAVVMALSTGTFKWVYGHVNGSGTSKAQSRPGAIKQNGHF